MKFNTIFLLQHFSKRFLFRFFPAFIVVVVIGLGIFLLPSQTLAQATNAINQNLTGFRGIDLSVQWLANFLKSFACYFIRFAIVSISVMIVVYGIMFLQSRGTPQGMTSAKKSLLWGLVGGIVIFAVFTIVLSVANLIGVDYRILEAVSC